MQTKVNDLWYDPATGLLVLCVAASTSADTTFEAECLEDPVPPPITGSRVGKILKWKKTNSNGAGRWALPPLALFSKYGHRKVQGSPPPSKYLDQEINKILNKPVSAEPACTCNMLRVMGSGHEPGCKYRAWHRASNPGKLFVD